MKIGIHICVIFRVSFSKHWDPTGVRSVMLIGFISLGFNAPFRWTNNCQQCILVCLHNKFLPCRGSNPGLLWASAPHRLINIEEYIFFLDTELILGLKWRLNALSNLERLYEDRNSLSVICRVSFSKHWVPTLVRSIMHI